MAKPPEMQLTAEKRARHENALIRLASVSDAHIFGALLYTFNAEFGESTPDAETIADRAAPLIASGEVTVLFAKNSCKWVLLRAGLDNGRHARALAGHSRVPSRIDQACRVGLI